MNFLSNFYARTIGRLVTFMQFKTMDVDEIESAILYNRTASFRNCPSKIESSKDGKTAIINDTIESQSIWIGAPSQINPMVPGYPKHIRPTILDDLLDTMTSENAQIMVTQTLIKRSTLEESDAVDETLAQIDQAKEVQIEQKGTYSRRYDHAADDVEGFSKQSFDGDHRIFRQSIVARVDGTSRDEVNDITSMITTKLRGQNVLTEIPYGGHLRSIKAGLPTNEILDETFTDVLGNVAATLWPARNPIQIMSMKGVLLGFTPTGIPLYADFESDEFMSKHFAIFGGSGTGKTTLQLYIDYNAAATNFDFIHIVPKEDMGTSHLNAIKALNGQLIKIGDGGDNFNPMMVFYDPATMGDDNTARRYAYRRHQTSLKKFFEFLIGSGFSTAMKSVLVATLKETYQNAKLVDKKGNPINTDKWVDGKSWPSIGDLRTTWDKWLTDESKKTKWRSTQALIDNTVEMEEGCAWEWMNNKNTFNPSSKFITIDVSGMEEGVREAVTILLIDIINMRLRTPSMEAYKTKRRTLVDLDEGANLLQNPNMARYIEKLFREARAGKCTICFDNQDLKGAATILPILKANTDFIILMCNMTKENVEEFGKEFYFTDKDKARLMEKGKGKYLLTRLGAKIPGQVVLTRKMKEIFFGDLSSESNTDVSFSDSYEIDSRVAWIRNKGLISSEWITKMDDYEIEGFTPCSATSVLGGAGKLPIWIRDDLISENGRICGESEEHWETCYLAAGALSLAGYTCIKVNTWGGHGEEDADITCISPQGERIWIEYEHPGSHSIRQIETKKQKQYPWCDVWICMCQKKNYQDVKQAVGAPFCLIRGAKFAQFIEKHGIKKQETINTIPERIEVVHDYVSNDTELGVDICE